MDELREHKGWTVAVMDGNHCFPTSLLMKRIRDGNPPPSSWGKYQPMFFYAGQIPKPCKSPLPSKKNQD
eukprot:g46489.t1